MLADMSIWFLDVGAALSIACVWFACFGEDQVQQEQHTRKLIHAYRYGYTVGTVSSTNHNVQQVVLHLQRNIWQRDRGQEITVQKTACKTVVLVASSRMLCVL